MIYYMDFKKQQRELDSGGPCLRVEAFLQRPKAFGFCQLTQHCVHVTKVCLLFKQYKNYLHTQMGTIAKFWMSYIDLVERMLNLIRPS